MQSKNSQGEFGLVFDPHQLDATMLIKLNEGHMFEGHNDPIVT